MHCLLAAISGTSTCKTQGGSPKLQQAAARVSKAEHGARARAVGHAKRLDRPFHLQSQRTAPLTGCPPPRLQ